MKTISLRELHNNTGKWVRLAEDELEIIVTDRGKAIASLKPLSQNTAKKVSWRNRDYVPGYLTALKAGKLKSPTDSMIGISEDRTSRGNSVAGTEE